MKHINLFEEYSTPYSTHLSGLTPEAIEGMDNSQILSFAKNVIDKGDKDTILHLISLLSPLVKKGKIESDSFYDIINMGLNTGKVNDYDIEKFSSLPDSDTIRDYGRSSLYNSLSNEIDTLANDINRDIKSKIAMFISKHKLDYSDKSDLSNYIVGKIKKKINY
jgi:hypothetical protein